MSVLDELERFLAKYNSPDGVAWADGKDFQAQLENAAPALLRLARAAEADIARECGMRQKKANCADCHVCPALRELGVEV